MAQKGRADRAERALATEQEAHAARAELGRERGRREQGEGEPRQAKQVAESLRAVAEP